MYERMKVDEVMRLAKEEKETMMEYENDKLTKNERKKLEKKI